MKKLKIFISILIFLGIAAFSNKAFALTSGDLISVGTGNYSITVNTNTSISDISKVLGEPKLETSSAFGGKAYTFYTDDDYNNYLYVETDESGKIISFGSVDPTYKTRTYSYGDKYNYRENGALHGCLLNNNSVVEGGVYYNRDALVNGSVSDTIEKFKTNYGSEQSQSSTYYLKGIVQHAILMYNAISTRVGNKTNLKFNEDFFYINEQLKESGSSIKNYLSAMDKSSSMKVISRMKEDIELSNSIYYMLNPLMFASSAIDNKSLDLENKTIAVMDYDINKKQLYAIAVSEDIFDQRNVIDLTNEETSRLAAGRAEYEEAMKNFKEDSELYEVEPQSTDVSTLRAGKLKQSKKVGITNYINAIRVAAGLPKLKISEDAFLVAQHISTLISYRLTELKLPIKHVPEQPDGLSDEYYKIAIGDGKGYTENLGYSATLSSYSTMMYYINLFLDDSTETPQNFSHRAKILDPEYTYWGFGISPYTFSNEFYGYKASNIFLEAWPAEGVTFLETLTNRQFFWTAQFLDKYKITDTTTVNVKCLNTGETWSFNTEEDTSNRKYKRYINAIQSINNKVVFYDNTTDPKPGYVYQVTISNIQDTTSNTLTSYSYRTVFEYADMSNYPTTSSKIEITPPSNIKTSSDGVYFIPIGEEIKFSAILDESATNKKVTWVSSNPTVRVTQNGTVIADDLTDEDVTIGVSYDGSENVTAQVIVRPYKKIDQVKLDPNTLELEKGESGKVTIKYIPEDATEETQITWKVVSCKNETVKYDIDDEQIRKFVQVDVDSNDPLSINVNAVDAEVGNNKYKIIAYVKGISGDYTGTCTLTINVPLDMMNIRGAGFTYTSAGEGEPRTAIVNYNEYYNQKNTNIFELEAEYIPENTTIERNVTWNVSDSTVVSKYVNSGSFRIDQAGTTTITATYQKGTENEINAILYLTINVNLESITLSGQKRDINLELKNGKYTATDKLTATRYPDICTDKIVYRSSNDQIATVDEDGNVTFNGTTGIVTITASNEAGNITSSYQYNVSIPITNIYFKNTNKIIKAGEAIQDEVVVEPQIATGKDMITYSSSNKNVAIVDRNGTVRALSNGQTVITATIAGKYTASGNDISVSYNLEVGTPLESISTVDSIILNIEEGSDYIYVTYNPYSYTDNVTTIFESTNTNVLTVDKYSGKITPVKSGNAVVNVTVTAKNSLGEKVFKKSISVKVKSVNDPDYLKGDLDRNGIVDANDAAVARDLYKYNNPTYEDLLIGDMDENGLVDANDASLILDVYKYGN